MISPLCMFHHPKGESITIESRGSMSRGDQDDSKGYIVDLMPLD